MAYACARHRAVRVLCIAACEGPEEYGADTLEGASMSANAERRAASATVKDEDPSARWPGWLPVAAVGLVVVRRICG